MSLLEIYRGQDGSLFKIKRLAKNPVFFIYEKLSKEETLAVNLPSDNDRRIVSKAGSFGDHAIEPAANDISPGWNETDHVK